MQAHAAFSEQLRSLPPAVRATVQAARRAVMAVAPTATEVPYRGRPPRSKSAMWKLVRYAIEEGSSYVVAIGAFAGHASLFFPRGRELEDHTGPLEGSGAQFRFITLRAPADAEQAAVKKVLRKAFQLDSIDGSSRSKRSGSARTVV